MTGMSHLKYMVLGGGGLFIVLLVLGVAPQSAIFIAIALACPLMMVFMMGGHAGHDAGHGTGHDAGQTEDRPTDRAGGTTTPESHRHH